MSVYVSLMFYSNNIGGSARLCYLLHMYLAIIYFQLLSNIIFVDCTAIHSQCTECSGEGASDCEVCASGYNVIGGSCGGELKTITNMIL